MNPNATVDQMCSNAHGTHSCAAGWKSCPCPNEIDRIQKVRRRGDPGPLPPREESEEYR